MTAAWNLKRRHSWLTDLHGVWTCPFTLILVACLSSCQPLRVTSPSRQVASPRQRIPTDHRIALGSVPLTVFSVGRGRCSRQYIPLTQAARPCGNVVGGSIARPSFDILHASDCCYPHISSGLQLQINDLWSFAGGRESLRHAGLRLTNRCRQGPSNSAGGAVSTLLLLQFLFRLQLALTTF